MKDKALQHARNIREIPKTQPGPAGVRIALLVLAAILGSFATWMIAAELVRPSGIKFTTKAQSAASIYTHRDAATTAAWIGFIRGDLWTEATFAYGDTILSEQKKEPGPDMALIERTYALAKRAIAYAPYDSRLWLLVAVSCARLDDPDEKVSAALRMSYYTGSDRIELVPERLLLALSRVALHDREFQELVHHDIQLAVAHKSELRPAIVAAYNNAPLYGKQFLKKALAELDSGILLEKSDL